MATVAPAPVCSSLKETFHYCSQFTPATGAATGACAAAGAIDAVKGAPDLVSNYNTIHFSVSMKMGFNQTSI